MPADPSVVEGVAGFEEEEEVGVPDVSGDRAKSDVWPSDAARLEMMDAAFSVAFSSAPSVATTCSAKKEKNAVNSLTSEICFASVNTLHDGCHE